MGVFLDRSRKVSFSESALIKMPDGMGSEEEFKSAQGERVNPILWHVVGKVLDMLGCL